MRHASRLLVALALAALATASASPAGAKAPGPNGQIAFSRPDPATGEPRVFIANPDGTHEHQLLLPVPGDGLVWSPDGGKLLALSSGRRRQSGRPRLMRMGPASRSWTSPAPARHGHGLQGMVTGCHPVLCQAIRFGGDPSLNGIYTIGASDGSGLGRLTVNPYPPEGEFGGGDIPGDFSPDGSQFVFMRAKPGADPTPVTNRAPCLWPTPTAPACGSSRPMAWPTRTTTGWRTGRRTEPDPVRECAGVLVHGPAGWRRPASDPA